MITWLKKLLLSQYLGSFIRHGLTALGALLVAKGILPSAEPVEAIISPVIEIAAGVAAYLMGQGASLIEKKVN